MAALKTACASGAATVSTGSGADRVVSGTVAGAAGPPVSLVDGTDAAGNPVAATTVGPDGGYTFGGAADPLRASASYTVRLGDDANGVTATQTCSGALTQVQGDEQAVLAAERQLDNAIGDLDDAVTAYLRAAQSTGVVGFRERFGFRERLWFRERFGCVRVERFRHGRLGGDGIALRQLLGRIGGFFERRRHDQHGDHRDRKGTEEDHHNRRHLRH